MDNYLSLLGRGLTKRKKFISRGEIGYAVSLRDMKSVSLRDMKRGSAKSGRPRHPILTDCSANDRFFPLSRVGFQPELFNYLIV